MRTRFLGLAVLAIVGAAAAGPAWADNSPITVNVRIEGKTKTLFEGRVTTHGHAVDSGDGTGPHACDGTNAGANPTPGPTLFAAFDDARAKAGITWAGAYSTSFHDFTIDRVGPDSSDTTNNRYWGQVLNFKDTQVGGCQQRIAAGDDVLIAFDSFSHTKLELTGKKQHRAGKRFRVTVLDGGTGKPFKNATVGGHLTDASGHATLRFSKAGAHRLKASAAGAIRSNRLTVTVSAH
jgi:hypothetical protein